MSNLYTSEKKFVCGYFQLLFVCELSEMASSKKLQKTFRCSDPDFFFHKKLKFRFFWYSAKLNGTYAEAINKQNQHFNAAWTHLTYAVLGVSLLIISKVWAVWGEYFSVGVPDLRRLPLRKILILKSWLEKWSFWYDSRISFFRTSIGKHRGL